MRDLRTISPADFFGDYVFDSHFEVINFKAHLLKRIPIVGKLWDMGCNSS